LDRETTKGYGGGRFFGGSHMDLNLSDSAQKAAGMQCVRILHSFLPEGAGGVDGVVGGVGGFGGFGGLPEELLCRELKPLNRVGQNICQN